MDMFEDLSTYKGRISRRTYWEYAFVLMGLQIGAFITIFLLAWGLAAVLAALGLDAVAIIIPTLVSSGLQVIFLVLSWRVALKRCHDLGHSGSYLWMLGILPIVDIFWLFIELGFVKGTRGPNHFGPDPAPSSSQRRWNGKQYQTP